MYTILLRQDKQLVATEREIIYQREKLVDKLRFLVPQDYKGLNLSEYRTILKYVDQGNVSHAEILTPSDEVYEGYIQYFLPVDTKLTAFAGNIEIRLSFVKTDTIERKQYVTHTREITITINPINESFNDTALEFVDQIVSELDMKIDEVKKAAELYDKTKADNLSYENSKLQLTSNGNKIGNVITISSGGSSGGTGFDVVEF